jgi:hypothetical protein
MASYLRSPLTFVWLVLTGVTFLSWWVGSSGGTGELAASLPVTIGVLSIAVVKTRLVFWHFMEVRSAPAWLRWSCDGWLACLGLILIGSYLSEAATATR